MYLYCILFCFFNEIYAKCGGCVVRSSWAIACDNADNSSILKLFVEGPSPFTFSDCRVCIVFRIPVRFFSSYALGKVKSQAVSWAHFHIALTRRWNPISFGFSSPLIKRCFMIAINSLLLNSPLPATKYQKEIIFMLNKAIFCQFIFYYITIASKTACLQNATNRPMLHVPKRLPATRMLRHLVHPQSW